MKTMRSDETVSGMERGKAKRKVEEGKSSMVYLIYCENFCKCHNVPPPSKTIRQTKV
jgi:hypothetical protein